LQSPDLLRLRDATLIRLIAIGADLGSEVLKANTADPV
jgi:hypothetical protein